ncbi:hypothetical protein [Paenibacillus contaminans]|uniref:DUF4258 domain-containing protein n=1 Tax=Paenibacillus contaminans TaxID=450362 RepID=A0A329MLQ7_9BACL|nr:hypothetical protein [Paenibacillus contaminans]RAV18817.1 hypothetical protein DQG23_24110 [Paenibacillus contaminans]
MAYVQFRLRISRHAHEQYCKRVEPIDIETLTEQCQQQLDDRNYDYNRKDFIHLAGVWWVYQFVDNEQRFITCYGRTNMNIPYALRWAAVHKDRVDLLNGLI